MSISEKGKVDDGWIRKDKLIKQSWYAYVNLVWKLK